MPEEKEKRAKRIPITMWVIAIFLIGMTCLWFFSENIAWLAIQWKIKQLCKDTWGAEFSHEGVDKDPNGWTFLKNGSIHKKGAWSLDLGKLGWHVEVDWRGRKIDAEVQIESPCLTCFQDHSHFEKPLSSFSLPFFDCVIRTVVSHGQLHFPQSPQINLSGEQKWREGAWDSAWVFYDNPGKIYLKVNAHLDKEGNGECTAKVEEKGAEAANHIFWHFLSEQLAEDYQRWKLVKGECQGSLACCFEKGTLSSLQGTFHGTDIALENPALSLKGFAKDFLLEFDMSGSSFFGSGLNGVFLVEEGKLASLREFEPQQKEIGKGFNDLWKCLGPFHFKDAKFVVKKGQIESSSIQAEWLGMQGDLVLNWLSPHELVRLKLQGGSKEMPLFFPAVLREGFEKAFPDDVFFIDCTIKRTKQGIELEGCLDISSLDQQVYHFQFGCQFGKNPCEDKNALFPGASTEGVEPFFANLKEQFYLSKRRLGWFRGKGIPIEKFLSPFLFREGEIQAKGAVDLEGTFDERCLIVFYDGDALCLESPNFAFSATHANRKASSEAVAIHYLDFSTFEHVGVLPLCNAVYHQKNLGLNFTEGTTTVHFENQKVTLRELNCKWKEIVFEGEIEIDIHSLAHVDLKLYTSHVVGSCEEVREFFSCIIPSGIWKIPLEGEVSSGERDVFLHFECKPKTKLIEGVVRGTLSTACLWESYRLEKGHVNFEYDVCKNTLLFQQGEGLLFLKEKEELPFRVDLPELAFFNFPFPQVALEGHLWQGEKKIFSCEGHTEGNLQKRMFFLEGDSFFIEGVQEQSQVKVGTFEWGMFKGSADLSIDEKGCSVDCLQLKYGELGSFRFDGKMDFQTAHLNGELNHLIIDLTALSSLPHLPDTFERWISLWNPRGKLCGQGEVNFSFNTGAWSAETISSFHALEFGGMHLGDGENLRCCYSSQGLLVKGLEGQIPGGEAPLKYKLDQLHYDYANQKIAFDEFNFSLPSDRLSWVASCASSLFPGKIPSSLIEWVDTLKQEEPLEGAISVSVFPDHVWVYLTLKDGPYFFNHQCVDLKHFSLLYDACGFNMKSRCTLFGKEYWAMLAVDTQKMNQGTLILSEEEGEALARISHTFSEKIAAMAPEIPLQDSEDSVKLIRPRYPEGQDGVAQCASFPRKCEKCGLVFYWERDKEGVFHIRKIEGTLSGLDVKVYETGTSGEKRYFKGVVKVDAKRSLHFFPKKLQEWLNNFQLGKGYILDGDFTFYNMFSDFAFCGGLYGRDFMLGGIEFSSLYSEAVFDKNGIKITDLYIKDKGGELSIPQAECFQEEERWHLAIPKIELLNLRLNQLKKGTPGVKRGKSLFKSLVIPRLEIEGITGIIGEKNSFAGKGEMHFMHFSNLPPKNIVSNLLLIPSEITARIGLDLSLLVPARGTVHYQINEGKIHLTDLENMYSEGKRSRFYLAAGAPAYLDFEGNLNFKIKMKQYNLLMKLAELFTITVKGTLFKPTYTFTNQFDEFDQEF